MGYEEIDTTELERRGNDLGKVGGIVKGMEMTVISERRSGEAGRMDKNRSWFF